MAIPLESFEKEMKALCWYYVPFSQPGLYAHTNNAYRILHKGYRIIFNIKTEHYSIAHPTRNNVLLSGNGLDNMIQVLNTMEQRKDQKKFHKKRKGVVKIKSEIMDDKLERSELFADYTTEFTDLDMT